MQDDCLTCRMQRMEAVLVRIANALENSNEAAEYRDALYRWQIGQGKHPDD
jgi:hypothetical protein